MTIGIYALRFNGTDKVYIGQSVNIEKRFKQHIASILNNYANYRVLEAYKIYGLPSLQILIDCLKEELNQLENEAIEIFNSVENGLNILNKSEDMPKPDNSGENHGNSKITNKQVLDIFNYLIDNPDKSAKFISIEIHCSIQTVYDISCSKSHLWLKDMFPDRYQMLVNLKGKRGKYLTIVADKLSAKGQGIVYPPIISSDGEVFNIENLNKFAREHELDASNLCNVLNGKRKSHKGWKLA